VVGGRPVPVDEIDQGITVLMGQIGVGPLMTGGAMGAGPHAETRFHAEQRQKGGGHVDETAVAVDQAEGADPGPGHDERSPGLDHSERTVLAPVLLLAVSGGVQDTEVGRAAVVEDLGHVFPGVGIAVVPPVGVPRRPFGVQRSEAGGILVRQGIPTVYLVDLVGPTAGAGLPAETDVAVDAAGFIDVRRRRAHHHFHQRPESRIDEHLDCFEALIVAGGAARR
jgi:hypothetical protein